MTRITAIEISDAADFARLTEQLPDGNRRHHYRLRDPAAAATAGPPLCRHVLRAAGPLQVSEVEERLGTEVLIGEPGIPAHCFSDLRAGAMSLRLPGAAEAAEGGPGRGLAHRGQGGTRALTRDGTARTNLWVSAAVLDRALAACLDQAPRAPLLFRPAIDWEGGAGPAVRRLLWHAAAEFARPDGMGAQPLALAGFADLFAHTVLAGLPHNHAERLLQQRAAAAPRQLRRAEEFMRARAAADGTPIRLAEIARAAGCSVRSLQNAFRDFRGTTPHAALRDVRLELARAALAAGCDTVAGAARRHGFSNTGRFAAAFLARFGERPRRGG